MFEFDPRPEKTFRFLLRIMDAVESGMSSEEFAEREIDLMRRCPVCEGADLPGNLVCPHCNGTGVDPRYLEEDDV